MRVPYESLRSEFERVLLSLGFTPAKAGVIATIFADNSRDGVYTHGLNRFPAFVQFVKAGHVDPHAEPSLDSATGALERWNGHFGLGPLNARHALARAIELARQSGLGCVALRHTNHWMRGGTYGWQAAEAGFIGICFTNTTALMPAWGGTEPRLGNNPLVIAVPNKAGHLVLDMAMSQFSMGKLAQYQTAGTKLPVPGGYDSAGQLSDNPADILAARRPLPIGFWKGSGLALMLDVLATVLSHGNSTADITRQPVETGVSQVFICLQADEALCNRVGNQIIDYVKSDQPEGGTGSVRYPGEGTLSTRAANLKLGIPVDEAIWSAVLKLG